MMGHRHITTTERYLHYAPEPDAAAKVSGLWRRDEPSENVVSIRPAALALGEPLGSLVVFGGTRSATAFRKGADLQRLHPEATTGIEPV
jgi:hypothetical protein